MATSKISYEHPTSISLGALAADNQKEFYQKIIDNLSYLPDDVTGTYRATWAGLWTVYGVYCKASSAIWITAIRHNNYIVSVLKNGNDYTYSKTDLTVF